MLILPKHAQQNVARDRLDLAWIAATITTPQHADRDPKDATLARAWRRIPQRSGRVLPVVFRPAGADIVVLAAFFDREARRWLPT
jgi:hypothetical protein